MLEGQKNTGKEKTGISFKTFEKVKYTSGISFFGIYIKNSSVCRLFATYRPHVFPGAALRDRLTRRPPCGRKWRCETRAEEVLRPHTLSVVPCTGCSMQKVEEMFAVTFFKISWTVYLSCYQRKKWRWRTPVGWDTDSVCISLPGAPKKRRSSGSRNLAARRSQETPVQAGTRRARNQESEPPFRRDSRNCWAPEEKEMSVCLRRPSCPEGKRPRASGKSPSSVYSFSRSCPKTVSRTREVFPTGSTTLLRLQLSRTRDCAHRSRHVGLLLFLFFFLLERKVPAQSKLKEQPCSPWPCEPGLTI